MTSSPPSWARPAEMFLTAGAAIVCAVPATMNAAAAFDPDATPSFRGAVAALALLVLAALASLLVGAVSHAGAFVLRAPVVVFLVPVGSLIGGWATPVLLGAAVLLTLSLVLLVVRYLDDDAPTVSHLGR